jgi:hypothetical protein
MTTYQRFSLFLPQFSKANLDKSEEKWNALPTVRRFLYGTQSLDLSRPTVQQCLYFLSAERMQRDGVFRCRVGSIWSTTFRDSSTQAIKAVLRYSVQLASCGLALSVDPEIGDYTPPELKLPGRYRIPIASTRPHLGGTRYWFECPLLCSGQPCGRRVGKLWMPARGAVFGCRQCYGLTYRSCQQHDKRKDALARDPQALSAVLAAAPSAPDARRRGPVNRLTAPKIPSSSQSQTSINP